MHDFRPRSLRFRLSQPTRIAFLASSVAWLVALLLPAAGLAAEPEWTRLARIAGLSLWVEIEQHELDAFLDDLAAQKVTVIEADSCFSLYLTDQQFQQELALMTMVAAGAHARNMRVVWYYPALEVLTPDGEYIDESMAKEHPDWLQIGLDGTENVFYGGGGRIHWVEEGTESAWMSPASPYKQYFIDRVEQMVATGIDGLWLDVPLFNDIATSWAGAGSYSVAKFESETGFDIPEYADWDDPAFRRWVAWRQDEISGFIRDVAAAARAITPDFPVIVETVTMDYNAATAIGLDGSHFRNDEGIIPVWEIDALSDDDAMRKSQEDDWLCLIAMNKFGRGAAGSGPSWAFTYGKESDDAELVMAESLVAGNNPYETKIPNMTTTVGGAYRQRMFGFIEQYSSYLFTAQSSARVAILYSSASRDYVDRAEGVGLYADTTTDDDLWWASYENDSAYERRYLAEYRGMVKLLVHEHIPFDVVVKPTADELTSYSTVVLPNVEAISDAQADVLREYVSKGGNVVVTGPNPGGMDEYGNERSEYALADVLGFGKNDTLPEEAQNDHGAGTARYYSDRLGKQYFVASDVSAKQTLAPVLAMSSSLTTDADRRVHFELSEMENRSILQFVNFIGMDGSFYPEPTSFSVSLAIPSKQVVSIELTSPGDPALAPVSYTVSGTGDSKRVDFDVSMDLYSMAVVTFAGAQSAVALGLDAATGASGVVLNWSLQHAPRLDWLRLLRASGGEDLEIVHSWEGEAASFEGQWIDADARPGRSYRYQLIAGVDGTPVFSNETTVEWNASDLPTVARLLGAWPNPFNPRTEIRFVLPQRTSAQLQIFDLAGRRVRTLELGSQPAGAGRIEWDGRDAQGRAVSSGSYLIQLFAAGSSDRMSITLVK